VDVVVDVPLLALVPFAVTFSNRSIIPVIVIFASLVIFAPVSLVLVVVEEVVVVMVVLVALLVSFVP